MNSELIEIRRLIHSNPELKYEEFDTSLLVQNKLKTYGLDFESKIAGTGVVSLVDSGKPGPTVLLRADMDALPIQEENQVSYRSKNSGKMHACGHDGHTAILLGLAKEIAKDRSILPKGRILLCFQPAEEGGNGADNMIKAGILEKYAVDACYGLHLWNHIDIGQVGVVSGTMMASVDSFEIIVHGKSGHGALPQHTIDPILVASHIVTSLQSIVSRNIDPLEPAVITVGTFHSGEAFNGIPEIAKLTGTVRAYSKEVYELLPNRFESIVENTAKAFGANVQITYDRIDKPTINHAPNAELVSKVAKSLWGESCLTEKNTRTMGGEDFSAFLMKKPGCYFFLGSRNEKKGYTHPHHSSYFDFDEDALELGVAFWQALIPEALLFG